MTEAKRRITITKQVSLAKFGEDWSDCYALVVPATRATYEELANLDIKNMSQAQSNLQLMDTVKQHFVSGTIKVYDPGTQSFTLAPMVPEDIDASLELANHLYIEIMGLKLDPKDSSGEVRSEQPPAGPGNTTETTSSTELPSQSPLSSSETLPSFDTSNDEASATTTH